MGLNIITSPTTFTGGLSASWDNIITSQPLLSSLNGTEEVLINDAGNTKKVTTQAIADLGGGGTPPTQALKTDTESTTSTTYADITGLTITVTPPSVTQSYILRAVLQIANGSAACFLRLAQDGVVIAQGDAAGLRSQMHVWVYHPGAYVTSSNVLEILVTPGTTSPVTFSVQWRSQAAGVASFCNRTVQDDDLSIVPRMVSTLMLIPSP
jgi:hypothetical protein